MPVDSKLHDEGDPKDRSSEEPKRGLRGAAGGIFIGSRTTPNRTTDYRDGGAQLSGSHTRPTGRTSFTGSNPGVQGTRVVQGQTVDGDHRAELGGDDQLGQDGRGTGGGSGEASIGKLATFTVADSATVGKIAVTPANEGGSCEVLIFADLGGGVDGALIAKDDVLANGAAQDTPAGTVANGNYAVYARKISAGGALGPLFGTRRTVTVA
jgi:hypothetical protein